MQQQKIYDTRIRKQIHQCIPNTKLIIIDTVSFDMNLQRLYDKFIDEVIFVLNYVKINKYFAKFFKRNKMLIKVKKYAFCFFILINIIICFGLKHKCLQRMIDIFFNG